MKPLSDPNRSVLLSPPDPPDASDAEVVEYEWGQVEKVLGRISSKPLRAGHGLLVGDVAIIRSSLQTIRELTEVKR